MNKNLICPIILVLYKISTLESKWKVILKNKSDINTVSFKFLSTCTKNYSYGNKMPDLWEVRIPQVLWVYTFTKAYIDQGWKNEWNLQISCEAKDLDSKTPKKL